MEKKERYYHITSIEAFPSVMAKGLLANEQGEIFLFDDVILFFDGDMKLIYPNGIGVAEHIAKNQVFLKDYVLIEIDSKGIKGDLLPDDVGEITKDYQYIVRQNRIKSKYFTRYAFCHL